MRSRSIAAVAALVAASAGLAGAQSGLGPQPPAPVAETEPLFDDEAGGFANGDDPAIWINPKHRAASLIVATAKEGGLRAFDLAGATVQSIPAPPPPGPDDRPGRFNNVDIVYGMTLGAKKVDLAVVSDRGRDTLRAYRIDPSAAGGPLVDVTADGAPFVFSADQAEVNEESTAYGLAAWSRGGRPLVAVSRRSATTVALLRLRDAGDGTVTYSPRASVRLPSSFPVGAGQWTPCGEPGEGPQVEGMVIDAQKRVLWAAQEDVGIWRVPLKGPRFGTPRLVERVREFGVPGEFDPETEECVPGEDPGAGGERISADVEGLTIYERRTGGGYLLASSQGDDTFAVFARRGEGPYLGSFEVADASDELDGAQVSDGAAVTSLALGPRFPKGLLVVHDGVNTPEALDEEGEPRENTNFKLVPWERVASAFAPPLKR